MAKYEEPISMKRGYCIVIALIIVEIACIVVSYCMGVTDFWGAIVGSVGAGLFVAIIQLLIDWDDQREIAKLKALHLIKIMFNRDQRDEYAEFIGSAHKHLDLMGVSASRFFSHFADLDQGAREESKVLLRALDNGVIVRILLPRKDFLDESKHASFEHVKTLIPQIKSRIPHADITIKYFSHMPTHSIFRVDDECIVGPIFPKLESKNTPAMRLKSKSIYAQKYLDYFENEWELANE